MKDGPHIAGIAIQNEELSPVLLFLLESQPLPEIDERNRSAPNVGKTEHILRRGWNRSNGSRIDDLLNAQYIDAIRFGVEGE